MGNQTDYFNKIGYKHTYDIGDRVFGYYDKIPFVGTVGNDRKINDINGPEVTVHLDLPMQLQDCITMFIIVKHKNIRRLTVIEEDSSQSKIKKEKKK
jgi:hypothetical protein